MVFVMGKLGKKFMTAAVLCFVLFLAGCGGMEEGAQASCPFLWYEKHVEEGKQYSIVAVTKDETYAIIKTTG